MNDESPHRIDVTPANPAAEAPTIPAASVASLPPIGLIAGGGMLPFHIAEGARRVGRRVACVGLASQYDAELPNHCDTFAKAGLIRIGRWIRLLRKQGVTEAFLVGKVRKARMYDPLRMFRQMPDLRAAKLWYRVLKHDRRSQSLLRAVADELASEGIQLTDTRKYIPELLADEGCMTRCSLTPAQQADVDFAWPLVQKLNALDIGQAIAVKDCEVVAVEAIEGTDEMIRRAGGICRRGGFVVVKTAMPHHDMRLDVPTVGPITMETLKASGGGALIVEAGRVLIAEKPRVLEMAARFGIPIVGMAFPRPIDERGAGDVTGEVNVGNVGDINA